MTSSGTFTEIDSVEAGYDWCCGISGTYDLRNTFKDCKVVDTDSCDSPITFTTDGTISSTFTALYCGDPEIEKFGFNYKGTLNLSVVSATKTTSFDCPIDLKLETSDVPNWFWMDPLSGTDAEYQALLESWGDNLTGTICGVKITDIEDADICIAFE
jgi:hypothetical protein